MPWTDVLILLVPNAVTATVAIYALRQSRKLKEMDLKDAQVARKFQLASRITNMSVDKMIEACYRLDQLKLTLAKLKTNGARIVNQETMDATLDAWNYIDRWGPLFPSALRGEMSRASSKLRVAIEKLGDSLPQSDAEIMVEAMSSSTRAHTVLSQFIDQHSILEEYADPSG
ncbi:MAG TPA: hypothetical protein VMY05_04780 [Acidobacteriota bacterium]|nr:hypothetical protein [Acidobacteriota bacterium]